MQPGEQLSFTQVEALHSSDPEHPISRLSAAIKAHPQESQRVRSGTSFERLLELLMIRSKEALGDFCFEHVIPGIFRRTPDYNKDMNLSLSDILLKLKIDPKDPNVLERLQETRENNGRFDIPELWRFKASRRFTTSNEPAFRIEGKTVRYVCPKPQRLSGVLNGINILQYFAGESPKYTSPAVLNVITESLNRKESRRGALQGQLALLTRLYERLDSVGSVFTATIGEEKGDGRYFSIIPQGFNNGGRFNWWGVISKEHCNSKPGDTIEAQLLGFNIRERRFEFNQISALDLTI